MKAAIFDQFGEPAEVLRVSEVEPPKPTPGQVRVRMLASPINPSDLLFIQGRYGLKAKLPATPGFEGVGVVEESGGGLLGWLRKGKRVVVLNDRSGNWQEQVVVPARQVVPVPAALSDEQAASFFVNPATALVVTRHVLRIRRGEWLLQSAAGGALGKMIVRLGKRDGFRTINLVRRREQVEELKQLGADQVLVEQDGPIAEQVRRVTDGKGVRCAMDPVGGETGTAVVASLSAVGHAVLYGALSGQPSSVDPRFLITGSKRVEGFLLTDWVKRQGVITMLKLFSQVRRLMQDNVLTTDVGEVFPLERVQDAVREAGRPGKGGKVLLRIGSQ
jgi:NADPH:quinone reductase-like Zn-dependent oxidoreductase